MRTLLRYWNSKSIMGLDTIWLAEGSGAVLVLKQGSKYAQEWGSRTSLHGKIVACVKVCLQCGIREAMSLAESAATPHEY